MARELAARRLARWQAPVEGVRLGRWPSLPAVRVAQPVQWERRLARWQAPVEAVRLGRCEWPSLAAVSATPQACRLGPSLSPRQVRTEWPRLGRRPSQPPAAVWAAPPVRWARRLDRVFRFGLWPAMVAQAASMSTDDLQNVANRLGCHGPRAMLPRQTGPPSHSRTNSVYLLPVMLPVPGAVLVGSVRGQVAQSLRATRALHVPATLRR